MPFVICSVTIHICTTSPPYIWFQNLYINVNPGLIR